MASDEYGNISSGAKKGKPITIRDVARMADVAVGTVSRVLNNYPSVRPTLAKRVRKVLRQTGYRPAHMARALSVGKTGVLHMFYNTSEHAHPSHDPLFLHIMDLAQAEAESAGYHLVFSTMRTDFQAVPPYIERSLDHLMADAALLVTRRMTDAGLEALRGRPLMLLDSYGKGIVSSVAHNYAFSTYEAVERLVDLGHKRIGYIGYEINSYAELERYHSFREEIRRRGLPNPPNYEVLTTDPKPNLRKLCDNAELPTALIVSTVDLASETLRFLSQKGLRVPADISLCVMDLFPEGGSRYDEVRRRVSGYQARWDHFVRASIQEVLAIIDGDCHIQHVKLPISYHDHGTVVPPSPPQS